MSIRKLFLFLCLFFSECCAAQFTTVTATVVDPDGVPYSYGTISGILIFSGGTPKLPSGAPYILPTQRTGFDASGHFVVTLADNNQLTPAGSKWNFEVCSAAGTVQPPIGTGPICFKLASPITITGPTVDITSQLNAIAPPLTRSTGGALADPGANGIIKRTNLNVTAPAVVGDVTALFAGCSGTQYLGADGACHTGVSGALPGIISATNPQIGNDANDRRMVDFVVTTDSSTSNPNFSDENNFQIVQNVTNGQANFGNATHAKKTFIPLAVTGNFQGSGQKVIFNPAANCYSMSDCFISSPQVTFAGGPIAGDEGQSLWTTSSFVQQQRHLNLATIASVTRSACNTTLTQALTASVTAQTFTVTSSTGCNVNDWVVLAQETPTGSPAESLMQITAVGSGTISGQVVGSYSNGNTVSPATVITTNGDTGGGPWGQDRVVVNLTTTPVTSGTVSAISGGNFTGSGTNWTAGMVGGSAANNIGCISLGNDIYTGVPFNGAAGSGTGPLNSWYPILAVSSTTSLGILSMSVAGDAAYHGNGVGSGAYTIRPCAKVLRISSDSRTVILDTNSFTWNVNDSLEEALNAYPDVTGLSYSLDVWGTGGTRRSGLVISNNGARKFQNGILLTGNLSSGGGADTSGWATGISTGTADVGFRADNSITGAYFYAVGGYPGIAANPCYVFGGGNLGNAGIGSGFTPFGWCADTTNNQIFANSSGATPAKIYVPALSNTTRTFTQTAAGSTGKVACWKDATSTLGFCSTAPDATGACTCN